ncbi:hypothetical protein KIPB_002793 [Kipferlia bialata]|uniref:Uncharacterized protein n=1 Tax=Kipferlia bialata TaxID=797122 RepID=A0A9K3GF91_9EUKA|nr:hypothetical protein KIPB_002793 [Kipferlia bialata]|eukprot:g2793.t1
MPVLSCADTVTSLRFQYAPVVSVVESQYVQRLNKALGYSVTDALRHTLTRRKWERSGEEILPGHVSSFDDLFLRVLSPVEIGGMIDTDHYYREMSSRYAPSCDTPSKGRESADPLSVVKDMAPAYLLSQRSVARSQPCDVMDIPVCVLIVTTSGDPSPLQTFSSLLTAVLRQYSHLDPRVHPEPLFVQIDMPRIRAYSPYSEEDGAVEGYFSHPSSLSASGRDRDRDAQPEREKDTRPGFRFISASLPDPQEAEGEGARETAGLTTSHVSPVDIRGLYLPYTVGSGAPCLPLLLPAGFERIAARVVTALSPVLIGRARLALMLKPSVKGSKTARIYSMLKKAPKKTDLLSPPLSHAGLVMLSGVAQYQLGMDTPCVLTLKRFGESPLPGVGALCLEVQVCALVLGRIRAVQSYRRGSGLRAFGGKGGSQDQSVSLDRMRAKLVRAQELVLAPSEKDRREREREREDGDWGGNGLDASSQTLLLRIILFRVLILSLALSHPSPRDSDTLREREAERERESAREEAETLLLNPTLSLYEHHHIPQGYAQSLAYAVAAVVGMQPTSSAKGPTQPPFRRAALCLSRASSSLADVRERERDTYPTGDPVSLALGRLLSRAAQQCMGRLDTTHGPPPSSPPCVQATVGGQVVVFSRGHSAPEEIEAERPKSRPPHVGIAHMHPSEQALFVRRCLTAGSPLNLPCTTLPLVWERVALGPSTLTCVDLPYVHPPDPEAGYVGRDALTESLLTYIQTPSVAQTMSSDQWQAVSLLLPLHRRGSLPECERAALSVADLSTPVTPTHSLSHQTKTHGGMVCAYCIVSNPLSALPLVLDGLGWHGVGGGDGSERERERVCLAPRSSMLIAVPLWRGGDTDSSEGDKEEPGLSFCVELMNVHRGKGKDKAGGSGVHKLTLSKPLLLSSLPLRPSLSLSLSVPSSRARPMQLLPVSVCVRNEGGREVTGASLTSRHASVLIPKAGGKGERERVWEEVEDSAHPALSPPLFSLLLPTLPPHSSSTLSFLLHCVHVPMLDSTEGEVDTPDAHHESVSIAVGVRLNQIPDAPATQSATLLPSLPPPVRRSLTLSVPPYPVVSALTCSHSLSALTHCLALSVKAYGSDLIALGVLGQASTLGRVRCHYSGSEGCDGMTSVALMVTEREARGGEGEGEGEEKDDGERLVVIPFAPLRTPSSGVPLPPPDTASFPPMCGHLLRTALSLHRAREREAQTHAVTYRSSAPQFMSLKEDGARERIEEERRARACRDYRRGQVERSLVSRVVSVCAVARDVESGREYVTMLDPLALPYPSGLHPRPVLSPALSLSPLSGRLCPSLSPTSEGVPGHLPIVDVSVHSHTQAGGDVLSVSVTNISPHPVSLCLSRDPSTHGASGSASAFHQPRYAGRLPVSATIPPVTKGDADTHTPWVHSVSVLQCGLGMPGEGLCLKVQGVGMGVDGVEMPLSQTIPLGV